MKAKVQLGDNVVTIVVSRIIPGLKRTKVHGELVGSSERIIVDLDKIIEYDFSENPDTNWKDILHGSIMLGVVVVLFYLILHLY